MANMSTQRAFLYGVLATVAVAIFLFILFAPSLVFHRYLCMTWGKPGELVKCRVAKGGW